MDVQIIIEEASRRLSLVGDPASRNLISQLLEVIKHQAVEIETLKTAKPCCCVRNEAD